MSRDEYGRIGILPFYQFVVGRDALLRKRITLGWYDYTGSGYLREVDLNNFVQDEISNSPILSQLGKSFQAFYICTGPPSCGIKGHQALLERGAAQARAAWVYYSAS